MSIIRIKSISFIIVALVLISITIINQNMDASSQKSNNIIASNYTSDSEVSQESEAASEKINILYTIREHNGKIAVFKGEETEPMLTASAVVNTLPEEDKRLIKKGVDFTSYKDMLFFLENYE